MAKLNLGVMVEVNSRNNLTYAIGTVANRANDNDINKAVVLDKTGDSAVKLAADSDEIRGFIGSVEAFTADGRSVGTYVRCAPNVRFWVTGSGLAVGDLVVCGAQTGYGVANAKNNNPYDNRGTTVVKKGTPTTYRWEVIRVKGPDLFLIEAI